MSLHLCLKARTLSALCGAALWAATGLAHAVPVSAWELSSVTGVRNGAYSFNDLFTVGATNVVVSSLGALDVNKDGFVSNRGIEVGLFRESDQSLLASTAVRSTDPLVGNYRFADITDLVLSANTAYRLVAFNSDDLYNSATGSPSVVDSRISWDSYTYCGATTVTFCDNFTGTERTWLGNFQLDSPGGTVPEPSSLALMAAGLLGLAARRRRA